MLRQIVIRFFLILSIVAVTCPTVTGITGGSSRCAISASSLGDPLISDPHEFIRNIKSTFAYKITSQQAHLKTYYHAVALIDLASERLESGVFTSDEPNWGLVIRYVLLGYGYSKGIVDSSTLIGAAKPTTNDYDILKKGYGLSSSYLRARGDTSRIQANQAHSTASPSVIAQHIEILNQAADTVSSDVHRVTQEAVNQAKESNTFNDYFDNEKKIWRSRPYHNYIANMEDVKSYGITAFRRKIGDIQSIQVIQGTLYGDSFSTLSWCQIDNEEGALYSIGFTPKTGFSFELINPEGPKQNWKSREVAASIIHLKAMNPAKPGTFLDWVFDYKETRWQQLLEGDRVYTSEDHKREIQALYPECDCSFLRVQNTWEKEKVLVLIIDPSDITIEKVVLFTRSRGSFTYEQTELFKAKADSIICHSSHFSYDIQFNYEGTDSCFYAKKIDLSDDAGLKDALPAHPSIKYWHFLQFNDWNKLLLAKHDLPDRQQSQYWIIQNDSWKLLHEGTSLAQSLMYYDDELYRTSYTETGLTIERFQVWRGFERTNVCDFPIQLIHGKFKSCKGTSNTLALQDYERGCYVWRFPELEGSISAINHKAEYENLIEKLRGELRKQAKPYAERALSTWDFKISEDGHIKGLFFSFPENRSLKGQATDENNAISIDWFDTLLHEDKFHHPLESFSVDVEGDSVPYYYVAPEGEPNGKTLVLMEGGPKCAYEGGYSRIIKTFSQTGWAVILPQESLRTGYGWKHFSKGFGEMGRKNLHQLLHVFQDAKNKDLVINLEQMHLYGCSYGGFVATSFALRWDKLHAEAGLEKLFNFQSIVADAAWVDYKASNKFNSETFIIGSMKQEEFCKTFMPLYKVGEPLSAPLTLIHGRVDVRCSATEMRQFSQALRDANCEHKLLWHKGGHGLTHERYPEFLLAIIEKCPTTELETAIGLTLEE